MRNKISMLIIAVAATALLLTGCYVSSSKDSKTGEDKDVDIKTPFGSLSVHKGPQDARDTGLAVYPGAQPKNDENDNQGHANVNISSSMFGLKVVAAKFQTQDSPAKVQAFYKKELGKYGNVLDCPSGASTHSFHRLEEDRPVTCGDQAFASGSGRDLKVGTENNQHLVHVTNSGTGSEFTLVYVRAWDHKDVN